ncbi:hypothetical protein [Roseovarius rhodophyticola]|uniref:Uncharacterized protein n=1 Tax=Roseovarius rhodophyticola TaxID=3080827 RepID=A0ABZ2TEE6_9RHOB|nr:hypothetical protein [Roseovarius sp. W115]
MRSINFAAADLFPDELRDRGSGSLDNLKIQVVTDGDRHASDRSHIPNRDLDTIVS